MLLLLVVACKKNPLPDPNDVDTGPGPYVPPAVALDKTVAYPGEVLTINYWQLPDADLYNGDFNGSPVAVRTIGGTLSFMVPNLSAGTYPFSVDIDGTAFQQDIEVVDPPQVTDPDQVIQAFADEGDIAFDSLQQYLDNRYGSAANYPAGIQQDMATWAQISVQAQQELSQMTAAEKEQLARLLAANQDWITAINEPLIGRSYSFKTAKDCQKIIQEGKDSLDNGATFAALGLGIAAYWCGVGLHIDKKTDNSLSKAATLWEATENQFAQITLINLIGRRIDQLSKEIDELGGSPSIADEILDVDGKLQATELSYCNGERKRVFADIRFRAIRPEDAQLNTAIAPFANFYGQFITAYNDYVATMTEPLVWRPEYRNASRVEKFNRFLSVPKSSVPNDKVILLNTQIVNDIWEVIFATDEPEEQAFNYDIVYDDGHVRLSKTFSATVGECTYAYGELGPGGGVIIHDYGNYDFGFRYIEITRAPIGNAIWGCFGDSIDTRSGNVGAGKTNTQIIVQACGYSTAAGLCDQFIQNGYDDWYLPSGNWMNGKMGYFYDFPTYVTLPDSTAFWTSQSAHGYADYGKNAMATSIKKDPNGYSGSLFGYEKNKSLPVYAVRQF